MAENESLDLGLPGGQRWNLVHDAVRKGQPAADVAKKIKRKLPAALRKAFKEFAEMGVPFADFIANRQDAAKLRRMARKCQGHEFAHLFAETAVAEAGGDERQIVASYLDGIIERVFDQIAHNVAGTSQWPGFPEIRDFMGQVKREIGTDVQRIAKKLSKDPTWIPTSSKSKKGDVTNPTREMLNMSLLGAVEK